MKGWTKIPNAILRDPSISVGARLLWCFIASQNRAPMTEAFICTGLGCSEGTFKKWRAELISLGLLKVEENRPKPSVYIVKERASESTDKGIKSIPIERYKNYTDKGIKSIPLKGIKFIPQKKTIYKEDLIQEEYNDDVVINTAIDKIKKFRDIVKHSPAKREQLCMLAHIDAETFDRYVDEILTEWEAVNLPPERVDWSHLLNHLRKKAQAIPKSRDANAVDLVSHAKQGLLKALQN